VALPVDFDPGFIARALEDAGLLEVLTEATVPITDE
jgi:hypothetical protein